MDTDRIERSVKQASGGVKKTVGKVAGDEKMEAEGRAEQAAGKVQSAIGNMKDAV